MKPSGMVLSRWLRAAWLQGLGWIACRGLDYSKYRIDLGDDERTIERKLRRRVRKGCRVAYKTVE